MRWCIDQRLIRPRLKLEQWSLPLLSLPLLTHTHTTAITNATHTKMAKAIAHGAVSQIYVTAINNGKSAQNNAHRCWQTHPFIYLHTLKLWVRVWRNLSKNSFQCFKRMRTEALPCTRTHTVKKKRKKNKCIYISQVARVGNSLNEWMSHVFKNLHTNC